MFTLEEISDKIVDYRHGLLSLGEFEEWFEDHATADAYDDPQLNLVCIAIDAALSAFHFDNIGADATKRELEHAIPQFPLGPVYARARKVVIGSRSPETVETGTSTSPVEWSLTAAR